MCATIVQTSVKVEKLSKLSIEHSRRRLFKECINNVFIQCINKSRSSRSLITSTKFVKLVKFIHLVKLFQIHSLKYWVLVSCTDWATYAFQFTLKYQSINQSINQSMNKSINQSIINQLIDQSINQSISQSVNQSINQSINQIDLDLN